MESPQNQADLVKAEAYRGPLCTAKAVTGSDDVVKV